MEVPVPGPISSFVSNKADIYLDEVPELPNGTPAPWEPTTVAYMADDPTPTGHTTSELYNSRATRHMTPYWTALTNYTAILPMPINAANQHTFHEIR